MMLQSQFGTHALVLFYHNTKDFEMEKTKVYQATAFALTDAGNAERLEMMLGDQWQYVPEIKRWLQWDGTRWREQEDETILISCVNSFRRLTDEIYKLPKPADKYERARREAVIQFIEKSESAARCRSALSFLKGLLAAEYSQFDSNPWLLNVKNGILDLQSGELRVHDKNEFLSKCCAASYESLPTTTLWTSTVKQILPVASIRRWVQKFLGYCLTADTGEEKFIVAFGPGGRGKGTLLETCAAAMGDYRATIPIDILLANNVLTTGNNPTPELAKLPGKRLVLSSESGKNRRLDEAKVKLLTGGDTISARRIGAAPFEFKPSFKLILQTNFLPSIADSTDAGIQRRLVIIPFNAPIAKRDSKLKQELLKQENLSACLSWMVEGLRLWKREGLDDVPPEALDAARKFYEENDLLAQWLAENTEVCTGGFLLVTKALSDFNGWLVVGGNSRYGRRAFAEAMERHGHCKERRNAGTGYKDLCLKFGKEF